MDYKSYFNNIRENNKMAADTINLQPVKGIPTGGLVHIMQHSQIERLAGVNPGSYVKNPVETYMACMRNIGMNLLDQYLAENPLSIGDHGYESDNDKNKVTGLGSITLDGVLIDSPEAVAEHIENHAIPNIKKAMTDFNERAVIDKIIGYEYKIQELVGPTIIKTGDGLISHPGLQYHVYGFENYFMAYALYPDVLEKLFSAEADYGVLYNSALVKAYDEGGMPRLIRFECDLADSRGSMVNMKSLDRIWFPHFSRSIAPVVSAGIKTLWHCDGNLMDLVPRLLDSGLSGFQGFQYEDGMDYKKICKMKTKFGEGLIIWAGVSVTRTLPFGKPSDVKKEIDWLVENGPETGMCLCTSSSAVPGVPWKNTVAMVEGFKYYREHGRKG